MVAVWFAIAFAQDNAKTITLETPGISLKQLCAELTRQTGHHYETRDSVQGDLLAIRVSQLPITEFLQKVCYVERLVTRQDGGTTVLTADGAARAGARAACMQHRISQFEHLQANCRALIRTKLLDDREAQEIVQSYVKLKNRERTQDDADDQLGMLNAWLHSQAVALRSPGGQALVKMFAAIDPADLAALDVDSYAVWSTHATPVEHQTSANVNDLFSTGAADEKVWSDALAKYAHNSLGGNSPASIDLTTASMLRLEISGSAASSVVVNLEGYASDGKRTFSDVMSLEDFTTDVSQGLKPEPAAPPKQLIDIPSYSAKLIRLWSAYPRKSEYQAWRTDPQFVERYFNPDRYDPASETFGLAMVELAEARGKQLVAFESGNDASWLPESCIYKNKLDLNLFESSLPKRATASWLPSEYVATDQWITLRPTDLDSVQREDFSRLGLGTLLRAARDHHAITLMDVAHFAADKNTEFGMRALRCIEPLESLTSPLLGMSLLKEGQWTLKCLLGRLDQSQIAVAQQPGGLLLSGCTKSQLEAVWSTLRYDALTLHGQRGYWLCNTTDGVPNGLPGGGQLHLSVETSKAIRARIEHRGGWVEDRCFSPKDLADRMDMFAHREKENVTLLTVQPAKRIRYVFRFDFPGDLTAIRTLDDDTAEGNTVRQTDQLPVELADAYRKAASTLQSNKGG